MFDGPSGDSMQSKPCPFCGSKLITVYCFDYSGEGSAKHQANTACLDCDAEGPRIYGPTDEITIEAAKAAWNNRATIQEGP